MALGFYIRYSIETTSYAHARPHLLGSVLSVGSHELVVGMSDPSLLDEYILLLNRLNGSDNFVQGVSILGVEQVIDGVRFCR